MGTVATPGASPMKAATAGVDEELLHEQADQ